ncbi:hypothetical protein DNL40_07815 [Xylanimonas oleitrophica]|uniref:Uncharacterized protein n=1 Tax=Xylanimonas oleitrophica TaxID=2607479 RepID=A0A2W5WQI2_9MICO|nr:hypothetical protein [Xylanimonas oleitrophica]PZR53410.1 hypothetical protein DNL40_07815 [Xylanimonas oleitrophica]
MTIPPDDLPRGTDGRIPQWVIDEAAGRRTAATGWRTWEPGSPSGTGGGRDRWDRAPRRRRRPRRLGALLTGAALLAAGYGWVQLGSPGLPAARDATLDVLARVTGPGDDVVALADQMYLTDTGRDVLYGARPRLLDRQEFSGRCEGRAHPNVPAALPADVGGAPGEPAVMGCYVAGREIVVYVPDDPRLRPAVVTTAAHEMLHAAWDRMGAREQGRLEPLLETAVAAVDPADPVHEQLAASVGDDPRLRSTELFAYLGSQVYPAGGLDPALEEAYARYVADREALVAVGTQLRLLFDQIVTEAETARGEAAAHEAAAARLRAQRDAEAALPDLRRDDVAIAALDARAREEQAAAEAASRRAEEHVADLASLQEQLHP